MPRVEPGEGTRAQLVQRTGPPGDEEAAQAGHGDGGQAKQRELRQGPAVARHGLRPGEAKRPCLELPGHEGGAPEDADQPGDHEDQRAQPFIQVRVLGLESVGRRCTLGRRGAGPDRGPVVHHVLAHNEDDDRQDHEARRRDEGLRPELADRQPEHWRSPFSGEGSSDPVAEPPGTPAGQEDRQHDEQRSFNGLEGPEPVGRLIGEEHVVLR